MTELEHYINSYFGLSKEHVQTITSFFHLTELNKGNFFLKEGQVCNALSFHKSGLIRVYVNTDRKEITQWISTKGYFVTDLSGIIFNQPSKWNILALTDSQLYSINKSDYNNLGHIIPQWHELEKLFIARCFTLLEDRIFTLLSKTAEERYQLYFAQNPELFNQVPLHYLASMMGMTPETLSRLRKKIKF
ncbi:Crp/Fnr family transcriptional regulator [Adhaeribacter radiodurans]|uniref:Crp/Fnr family transcriptional regulator n=1 Tax=Adhaeribacter radiodurans TaxID=2745197 RepID=A0A7L7L5F2_9BACT|nr:Crp/Fnr family transcriptional regulator [Adhaeribacter radiodurans]QMU28032.1 Crp/Fnr family transcriptional regulator [Adhaeribacter radiodurans]